MQKHTPGPWEIIGAAERFEPLTISGAKDPDGYRYAPIARALINRATKGA